MHVCLATSEYPPTFQGGIASYHLHLGEILHRQGHRVTVLTAEGAADGAVAPGPARVVRLDADVRRRSASLQAAFGPEMRPVVRNVAAGLAMRDWLLAHAEEEGFDVVETPEYGGAAAFLVAEHLPPVVVTGHGSVGQVQHRTAGDDQELHHRFLASLELAAVATADAVAGYGRANCAAWEAYLGRPVHYVLPPFLPLAVDDSAGPVERDGLLGITVARLNNWKGILEAAAALELCLDRGVDVALRWIGRDQPAAREGIDSMREHLERNHPRLWGKSLLWEPSLSPAEVRRAQAAADFALVPSRWDTFNFTAVEAMSTGTPLIVSSGAGASDLCRDGDNALVVPPGDAEALAAAMAKMRDEGLRRRLGAAGRETVETTLSPEAVAGSRRSVYEAALDRHRRRQELGHAASLMNPIAWQWSRGIELATPPAQAAKLPSGVVVREALRRLRSSGPRKVLDRLLSRTRRERR